MPQRTVSFGELYTRSAEKRAQKKQRPPTPAATPGFEPLQPDTTLLDTESTLPPSSTPEEQEETPKPQKLIKVNDNSTPDVSEATTDSFPDLDPSSPSESTEDIGTTQQQLTEDTDTAQQQSTEDTDTAQPQSTEDTDTAQQQSTEDTTDTAQQQQQSTEDTTDTAQQQQSTEDTTDTAQRQSTEYTDTQQKELTEGTDTPQKELSEGTDTAQKELTVGTDASQQQLTEDTTDTAQRQSTEDADTKQQPQLTEDADTKQQQRSREDNISLAPTLGLSPGDLTPTAAEDRLKALGVTAPQIPGANTLPDGRTIVVAQRQSVSFHEISPACKAVLSSPDFKSSLEAARGSVKNVIRDRSARALDDLKERLSKLDSQKLVTCDAGTAADLQTALTSLNRWSETQKTLAAASATVTRTQKAVEAAEAAANEARNEYQRQQEIANQTQQSSGTLLSQQLPRLYKSLKKWESLASGMTT